jgi:DMSO/TMAO reductase YedYZ molybdopterin-dependent catalytic subunit
MLLDSWMLMVDGLVHNPRNFNWTDFMELPQSNSTSDFHCVETWSVLNQNWQGVLFKDLASIVKPKKNAKIAWFEGADGYTTSLPIKELIGDDILLAHTLNDEPLPQSLGGPMRIVIPNKYAYKSAMWIKHIEFIEDERLGFWEKGIYSNTADVWKDDRYK